MADDMYDDLDWGDDPFAGDIDFDTDFDGSAKHGFIRSVVTGFLSGVVDKTIGDTDARIDILQMVLPRTWTSAFSIASDLNRRRQQIVEEMKKEGAHAIDDLQYLARRAGERLQKFAPNKIGEELIGWSKNDFSHWGKAYGEGGDDTPNMEGVGEGDLKDLLQSEDANSLLEREASVEVGKTTFSLMSEIGGRTVGGLNTLNMSMGRTNLLLEQVVDYQRRVQLRNDSLKVNLLGRIYLTNNKFYKFQEAAQHRMIKELKSIATSSAKSDYEKTSTSQAARKSMRDSVFNTVKTQFGGIAEWVTERLGKNARGEAVGTVGEIAGALRMALEMTDGVDFNLGSILGSAAGEMFVKKLPQIANSDKAAEYLGKFKKRFPEMAEWAEDAYKRLEDLGNVASYSLGSMEGMVNNLAAFNQGNFDFDDSLEYEDYLDRLKPGEEPLGKIEWTLATKVKKALNKGANAVLDDVYQSTGSRYSVERRTLNDGFEMQPWNRRSDRTLNEAIPALLEGIWHSVEKIRTGDDTIEGRSYDYVRGRIISASQREADAVNRVFDRQSFRSQADAANRFAAMTDTENTLSEAARRTLAMQQVRLADKKRAFSPYNFMELEKEGVDEKVAKELRAHFQKQYDITDELYQEFKDASTVDRYKYFNYLPTEAAREKAAKIAPEANMLGRFMPDMSARLDVQRNSGGYNDLKKTGVIKSENGYDVGNMDLFFNTLQDFINDPSRKEVRETPADNPFAPTRNFVNPFPTPTPDVKPAGKKNKTRTAPPPTPRPAPPIPPVPANAGAWPFNPPEPKVIQVENKESKEAFETLNKTLLDVKASIQGLSDQVAKLVMPTAQQLDLAPVITGYVSEGDKTRAKLDEILALATERNATLEKILARQPIEEKLSASEQLELKNSKKSILDRIKNTSFRDFFNKSVEKLLDHEPLILGGLLGGLAGFAVHDPKAAALVAGGIGVATIYGKMRAMSFARHAKDTMDLYEEGAEVPILEVWKLRRGDYYDMATKVVIDSWEGITGSLKDLSNNTIIHAKRLAGKLFTEENKEVFLKGLNKLRQMAVRAWQWFDPMTRLKKTWGKTYDRFYQMDVYVAGEDSPVLQGAKFAQGRYFVKDGEGRLINIKGWNEIEGAVYDADGNVLITEEEYEKGLFTSMGANINKLKSGGKTLKKWGFDLFGLVREKAKPYARSAWDKTRGAVTLNHGPVIEAIDRIYHLLLDKWGYKPGSVPAPEGPFEPPKPDLSSTAKPTVDGEPPKPEEVKANQEKAKQEEVQDVVKRRKARRTAAEIVREAAPDPVTPYTAKPAEEVEKEAKAEAEAEATGEPQPTTTKPEKVKYKPEPGWDAVTERYPTMMAAMEAAKKRYDERTKRETEENLAKPKHDAAIDDKGRLNSIADRKTKAKEKKDEQVKDAIIEIAKNFGFGQKDGEEQKKPKGVLGWLLGGMMVGIGKVASFFTRKFVLSGFTNLFSMGQLATRLFPAMATGIGAIAKGIMTLVQTKSLGAAAGSVIDGIRGDEVGENGERRRRPRRGKQGNLRRLAGGMGKVGLGMAVSTGAMAMMDAGVVDPDSGMGQVIDGLGTAATVYGGVQAASAVAGMAGLSLGSIAGGVATGIGGLLGGAWTLLAPLAFNPITLGVGLVGAAGYGVYKLLQAGKGKPAEIRMTQYGLSDPKGPLAEKILQAEQMLEPFIVIGNGRATLNKQAPIEQVIQLFMSDPNNRKELGDVFSWFNGRFKPVLLTYHACLDVVKLKSLKAYDESANQDTYRVAKQAHQALASVAPYPYNVVVKLDSDNPMLNAKMTNIRVNNLLAELKKYVDGKDIASGNAADLAPVQTLVGRSAESLTTEKAQLEAKLNNENTEWKNGVEKSRAKDRLKEVSGELARLNAAYKAGTVVGDIFIGDLMPEGKALDLLTAIRVATYGNDEDIPWRVEAVLKLERHCESMFAPDGEGLKFTGQIGDLFNRFKDAFQVTEKQADDWCLWFRDRFLPVLTNYMTLMRKYRRGRPGVVWKTLSATARYEIAKALIETQVEVGTSVITAVWNVKASPFKSTRSPRKYDKVDRMLKLLGEASTVARLKDPELEAGKTNAQSWANTISPHKTGGGFTDKFANVQTPDQYQNRRDTLAGGQFGTMGGSAGTTFGPGGVYKTPDNQFGYQPISGTTDTSHLDMSGVQQQADDGGVSVPKKLAEQLMIREMLKQGFTDPRAIAEMLALTNYESGGYAKTTENMKYSSPEQLVKLFKEVKSMEQARQLVKAGEVAIANTVYGGGKGASLGNTEPGDGYKFRGRGFVQLTGRANYRKIGQELGIDLENNPQLASNDPNVMAAIAVNFFKNSKLLQSITQTGDFGRAATGLNGGNALPGMDKRYGLYLSYLKQLQSGQLKADDSALTADVESQTGSQLYGGGGGGSTPASPPSAPASGGVSGNTGGAAGGWSPPATGGGSPGSYQTPANYGGGQDTGGGWGGGADDGGSLVNSNAAMGSGLRLKSGETVAGGGHHPGIQKIMEVIQSRVPNFRYFSAVNDAYHKNKGSKGAHPKGLACDFTLTNGIQGSDRATQICVEILRSAGLAPAEFLVINEYRKQTAIGTGGHVHVGFRSPQAADKFLQAFNGAGGDTGQDTTLPGGGPVQQTPEAQVEGAPPGSTVAMPTPSPSQQRNLPPMNNQNFDPANPMSEKGDPEDIFPQVPQEPTVKKQYTQLPLPDKPNPQQPLPEGYLANQERFAQERREDSGNLLSMFNDLRATLEGVGKVGDDQTKILVAIHKQLVVQNENQAQRTEEAVSMR